MNIIYIVILVTSGYILAGLICLGMESRWKISAVLLGAIALENKPKETYRDRIKKEIDKWENSDLKYSFFLWWILIICIIMRIGSFVIVRIWYFFYNGFRLYPHDEQAGTPMDTK